MILALALVGLLLAGCRPAPTSTPAPEATPTPTAEAVPDASPTPFTTPPPWTPGQLEIHLLDVGHGDTQVIISPTGETMLIDVAEGQAPKTAAFLRALTGQVAVDYLVVSHYHFDHIAGLVPLLRDEGLQVRRALLDRGGGPAEYDSPYYRDYYGYVSNPASSLKRLSLHEGDRLDMGSRLTVEVLSVGDIDTRTASGVPVIEENDNSVALWLTFGAFDYWTAGDLSGVQSSDYANIESAVIPKLPREADVYKADHHAIQYNNNAGFIRALNPTVSLVSSTLELARWEIITRLDKVGDVYITCKIPVYPAYGDIVVASRDGESYTVEGKEYRSK